MVVLNGGRPMPPEVWVWGGMTQSFAAFLCQRGKGMGHQAVMPAASTRAVTAAAVPKHLRRKERKGRKVRHTADAHIQKMSTHT